MSQYNSIDYTDPSEASKKHYPLFEKYKTSKFEIMDIGLSGIVFGIIVIMIGFLGGINIELHPSRRKVLLMTLLASLLSIIGDYFNIVIAVHRFEYPHWADSVGIPFQGIPLLFLFRITWGGLHSLIIRKQNFPKLKLIDLSNHKANKWIIFLILVELLLLFLCIIQGGYYYLPSSIIWLSIYLMIGRASSFQNTSP